MLQAGDVVAEPKYGKHSDNLLLPVTPHGDDLHHRTGVRKHRTASAPVASSDNVADTATNCDLTIKAICDREPPDDSTTTELPSPNRALDCDHRDVSVSPGDRVNNTAVVHGDNCIEKISDTVIPLRRTDDVEPVETDWQTLYDRNRLNDRPWPIPLVRDNSQTVNESSYPVSKRGANSDTANANSSEAGVSRKRRVSAARSALYQRLMSAETAGSSDVFLTLSSSDDDDDSDTSDVHLDSSSDHSYLVTVSNLFL